MAVFTEVSPQEAAGLLSDLDLGTLQSMHGATSGIENTNYFVSTDKGDYVLTLFERLSYEQLPFYLNLMHHLANRGIPVPAPQANAQGEILHTLKGKPAAVVTRLKGRNQLAPQAADCAQVGAMLARMQQELARSASYKALPSGPIHADLFRDNVMFDGPVLSGFFDFYFAGCDTFGFDIAVCLNDWCIDLATGAIDPVRAQAFVAAYDAQRALTDDELVLLPALLRAAALRFWTSRLWDYYLPRDAAMLQPHDPTHFERVLTLRRQQPWSYQRGAAA
ncbi:MAG: homoserine kinase [Aquabacterium sp.]|nr:homoserine kinase [Aquabacterium sp.]